MANLSISSVIAATGVSGCVFISVGGASGFGFGSVRLGLAIAAGVGFSLTGLEMVFD